MEDSYTLVWSFRNRFDVFKSSILSADATCDKSVDFVMVDAASSDETIRQLRELNNTIKDRTIRVAESTYRSSLSEAWNLGMMLTKNRFCMFASSDTIFLKVGWYEGIKKFMESGSKYLLVENHSLFCLDKKIITTVGWFDETYIAGPHFDCDYMIRASEMGITVTGISNDGFYTHSDDSETTKKRLNEEVQDRLPMNDFTNELIFKNKWQSSWEGWELAIKQGQIHLPHPPTNIYQVQRRYPERDAHPIYTDKYRN